MTEGSFPSPSIDQVIDLTARCEPLSILDAYSRRRGGPARQHVYHSLRVFLLHKNAIQIKERGVHLFAVYAVMF
jgi:hypothetical protein